MEQFRSDASELGSSALSKPGVATTDSLRGGSERKRFHTLDGLRGVAALFVASYHFGSRNGSAPFPGYLAVDLFFVLSGFVIALNYSDRLRCGLTPAGFARVRAVRLLPMYVLGLVLGLVKQLFGQLSHDPRSLRVPTLVCSVAAGSVMLPSPCTEILFPLNGPAWSLFFETVINLLFALCLWRASTRVLVIVVGASFAALVLTIGPPLEFNTGWSWPTAHIALFRTTFSFPVGILICRHFNHERLVTWAALIPVAVMSLAFSLMPPRTMVAAEQLFVMAIAFPVIVMLGIRLEAPKGLARLFSFLGDISYPVYALHFPIMPIVLLVFARLGLPSLVQLLAWIAVLIFLGRLAARADAGVRKYVTAKWRAGRISEPQAAPSLAS